MRSSMRVVQRLLLGLAIAVPATLLQAAEWSTTELQYQYGDLAKAFQGGGDAADTNGTSIMTFQHASGWEYGDNFLFFDHINYGRTDFEVQAGVPRDDELYGEFYSNFSLGKISGKELKAGFISDIGLIAGFNYTAEIDTLYYLPGVRFALGIPGFAFANLDVTAYLQDGVNKFGVKDDDSYMVDFSWAYPFTVANSRWSVEGHVEYIHGADQNSAGQLVGERKSWILAQPQLRLDLGNYWQQPDKLFVGVEYQYWRNKLGDADTNDNVAQFLAVWRF